MLRDSEDRAVSPEIRELWILLATVACGLSRVDAREAVDDWLAYRLLDDHPVAVTIQAEFRKITHPMEG